MPNCKALIIAVSEYNDESLPYLDLCNNDGLEISHLLQEQNYEIPKSMNLIGRVTKDMMEKSINSFFLNEDLRYDDTLVFYFSGHAIPDKLGKRHYLASSEIDPSNPFLAGFDFDALTYHIELSNSNKIVIILDCCFSGVQGIGGPKSIANKIRSALEDKVYTNNKKYVLLASSLSYQESTLRKDKNHSFFTSFLLEGLAGKEKKYVDLNGYLTVELLSKFLNEKIVDFSQDKDYNMEKQRPLTMVPPDLSRTILAKYPYKTDSNRLPTIDILITKTESYTEDAATYTITVQKDHLLLGRPIVISKYYLNSLNRDIHNQLKLILEKNEYERGISIQRHICEEDLKKIAKLDLFVKLFVGSGSAEFVKTLIDALRAPSKIRITSYNADFFFPWHLIYDKDRSIIERAEWQQDMSTSQYYIPYEDAFKEEYYREAYSEIDSTGFWGFKHVIEYVPLNMQDKKTVIDSTNISIVSINFDKKIDLERENLINDLERLLEEIKIPNSMKKIITTEQEAKDMFRKPMEELHDNNNSSIIYFFCHGEVSRLTADEFMEDGLLHTSYFIQLTIPENRCQIEALYPSVRALYGEQNIFFVKQQPLVFLNMSDSLAMDPEWVIRESLNFLKYIGSRGVVGTITSPIPLIFASNFGLQFLRRYLRGEKMGTLMRDLRKAFLDEHSNILGLFYTFLGSPEIQLDKSIIE